MDNPSCNDYLLMDYAPAATLTAGERQVLTPPTDITLADWADNHRIVPAGSRMPGRWQTGVTPFWRQVMDTISNPRIRHTVICAGTQIGKTEILINTLCYAVAHKPSPVLLLQPTEDLAKQFSRTRIQPSFEACDPIRARLPTDRNDYQTLEMHFPGAVVYLAGSNSAATLASKPVRALLRDEIDKYPAKIGRDADPLSLSEERTKSYWDIRTIVDVSSPTIAGTGILKQLQACDVVYYYWVPCPHCNASLMLDFAQVNWDKPSDPEASYEIKAQLARRTAYYTCLNCGSAIHDNHKSAMLAAGHWAPIAPPQIPADEIESAGYVISSLYSPWLRWGDIAEKYVKARQSLKETSSTTDLQNFENGWLAKAWDENYVEPTTEPNAVLDCVDTSLPRGVVPADSICLVAGIDTQRDKFYYTIVAYKRDYTCHVVDYGAVTTFDNLDTLILQRAYPVNGTPHYMRIFRALIDLGGDIIDSESATEAVLTWLRKYGGGSRRIIYGARGANYALKTNLQINKPKVTTPAGKPLPGLITVAINTYSIKKILHYRLSQGRQRQAGGLTICSGADANFARQVLSEELRTVKGKRSWCKVHGDNHYLDCLVYATAAVDDAMYGGLRVISNPWLVDTDCLTAPTAPAPEAQVTVTQAAKPTAALPAKPTPKPTPKPQPTRHAYGRNPYL